MHRGAQERRALHGVTEDRGDRVLALGAKQIGLGCLRGAYRGAVDVVIAGHKQQSLWIERTREEPIAEERRGERIFLRGPAIGDVAGDRDEVGRESLVERRVTSLASAASTGS